MMFGGVLWISRRQSQLESEPLEAVRSNPSRRHGSTRSRMEREARQTSGRSWCAEGADQTQGSISSLLEKAGGRHAQSSDGGIGGDGFVHSSKHFRVMLDVFDSTSGTRFERVETVAGCAQRGCKATGVPIDIVREIAAKMGSDSARIFCINGTVRVRDFHVLQSDDEEIWSEWAVSTKDHVLGCIKSSLPGRCHERDGNSVTAKGASGAQGLARRVLESLYGTRKTAYNWEKKWQNVLIKMNFEISSWSSAIVNCCERIH